MIINNRIIYLSITISGLVLLILILFPALDIDFSTIFYRDSVGFIYKNNKIWRFLFLLIPFLTKILCIIFFLAILYLCIVKAMLFLRRQGIVAWLDKKQNCHPCEGRDPEKKLTKSKIIQILLYNLLRYPLDSRLRGNDIKSNFSHHATKSNVILSASFYLLITATIGPGLIVNHILKENMGRARPSQIKEFGGDKDFTPAFIISDQCISNCAFPSGHAAMGYYFTSFAYIAPALFFTRIYLLALVFGSIVGLSRILMGGHFLSDVIASCFIILIINHLLYLWWKKI